jgi:hypothetical protein
LQGGTPLSAVKDERSALASLRAVYRSWTAVDRRAVPVAQAIRL